MCVFAARAVDRSERNVSLKQVRSGALARRAAAVHLQSEHGERERASFDEAPPPLSGVVPQVKPRRGDAPLLRATQQGHDYLMRVASRCGLQSIVGLDASFGETIAPRDLRAFVKQRFGADIGFDAGDESFSSMIALKLFTDDHAGLAASQTVVGCPEVVRRGAWRGRYRFFCDRNGFAADTDCTGVACATLYEAWMLTEEELLESAEELLESAAAESVPASANLDDATGTSNGELRAGVTMVYWDDGEEPGAALRGRKQDAAVAANTLYALKLAVEKAKLEDPRGIIEATQGYVYDHLRSGAYLAGTRYYPSPDTFLYYVSCLCERFSECMADMGAELLAAIERRDAEPSNQGGADDPAGPLNVAQRALAKHNLNEDADLRRDLEALLATQLSNGSWPAVPFYSLGKRALYFGSGAVTTMFAVKAIATGLHAAQRRAAQEAFSRGARRRA